MTIDNGRVLIVITGPIASGKSTIARAVAQRLERQGVRAAVIDLDLIYDMLDHRRSVPKDDQASWSLAHRATAALTDAFLVSGLRAVIVEGGFLSSRERTAYLDMLATPIEARFVRLHIPYEDALRRAQADPTRGASRDPAFLSAYWSGLERDLANVPSTDLVLDTARVTIHEAARAITAFARPS